MMKVFLSSTTKDLQAHRDAVFQTIQMIGYHCVRMEDFPVADQTPDDYCRARVAECNIFIGLVGHFYGSIPKGQNESFAEREYNAAVAEGITKWMFLADDSFPADVSLWQSESDEMRDRQRAFRRRVQQDRLLNRFVRPEELALRIAIAITHLGQPPDDPLTRLAEAVHTWFATLGYQFENHLKIGDDHFEYLISIPLGRGKGSNRILVRGVSGMADLAHFQEMRRGAAERAADGGWLVAYQRVSQAVRDEVARNPRSGFDCYTFDELIEVDANFDNYFNWLQEEVEKRGIDRFYVDLACSKAERDPLTQQMIAKDRYDDRNGGIDGYINCWLDDPSKGHLSILGEFGTGKTWCALHYAWTLLQKYLEARRQGVQRQRIPLVISLRDYARTADVEALLSVFFFAKHRVPLGTYAAFEQLNRMGKLLLIFDGFDEMAARVDRNKIIENFWQLAKVVVPGAKVILTSRTEYLPNAKETHRLLEGKLKADTSHLKAESAQFEILELEKLTDNQIREIMRRKGIPDEVVRRVLENEDLRDLARRPLMIEYILKALDVILVDARDGKRIDMPRVFRHAIERTLTQNIDVRGSFTSLADKLYFLCEISWEMLATGRMSLNYRGFPDSVRRFFGPQVPEERDVDYWAHDLRNQAMLIHNDDGDYFPAHKSLLEFFAAYKFVAQLGILSPEFTGMAQRQSHIDASLPEQDYIWSDYFRRELDAHGEVRSIPRLRAFATDKSDQAHRIKRPGGPEVYLTSEERGGPYRGEGIASADWLPRNTLVFAAGMVATDAADLDRLCAISWEETGALAWNALCLFPFLKHELGPSLADRLLEKSAGRPLRSGVSWVLGELGVSSDEVAEALRGTVTALGRGDDVSRAAWWEAAFALEKLGRLGPRCGRMGTCAVRFLCANLPPDYSLQKALENLRAAVKEPDPNKASIDQCALVTIVQHEKEIDATRLFRECLSAVYYAKDTVRRRCYFSVWLCGHLAIHESVESVVQATGNPLSSVRNCACEALGKIGKASKNVADALTQALSDTYYRARYHAAWSLGELMAVDALPNLEAAIKEEQVRDVRQEMERVRDLLRQRVAEQGNASPNGAGVTG